MFQKGAAVRRATQLARQGKSLGDEFKNAPRPIKEAAEAAHAKHAPPPPPSKKQSQK